MRLSGTTFSQAILLAALSAPTSNTAIAHTTHSISGSTYMSITGRVNSLLTVSNTAPNRKVKQSGFALQKNLEDAISEANEIISTNGYSVTNFGDSQDDSFIIEFESQGKTGSIEFFNVDEIVVLIRGNKTDSYWDLSEKDFGEKLKMLLS